MPGYAQLDRRSDHLGANIVTAIDLRAGEIFAIARSRARLLAKR